MLKKTIYLLPFVSLLVTVSACSSGHAYKQEFGLVEDVKVEEQLEKEELMSKQETEKFNQEVHNPEVFIPEKGTFLAEDWVQPETVITYLYPYDPKFYSEDELPENKARLGNVVVKVPASMNKEEFLYQLESENFIP